VTPHGQQTGQRLRKAAEKPGGQRDAPQPTSPPKQRAEMTAEDPTADKEDGPGSGDPDQSAEERAGAPADPSSPYGLVARVLGVSQHNSAMTNEDVMGRINAISFLIVRLARLAVAALIIEGLTTAYVIHETHNGYAAAAVNAALPTLSGLGVLMFRRGRRTGTGSQR
jgi:hypothetical protein